MYGSSVERLEVSSKWDTQSGCGYMTGEGVKDDRRPGYPPTCGHCHEEVDHLTLWGYTCVLSHNLNGRSRYPNICWLLPAWLLSSGRPKVTESKTSQLRDKWERGTK